ncbi:MAG: sensor histidine kinase [Alphaproteobacteria bacterium]|nr:sensor histidine kinase [Alphaproteobacteria bacterium]
MLRTNSLAFRLTVLAVIWSVLGLAAGVLVLSRVFRESAERGLDNRLVADLESVIAVTELDCEGTIVMPRPLAAERFFNPFSGWYWQISAAGTPAKPLKKSPSLADQALKSEPRATSSVRMGYITGPKQQQLRLAERDISFPGPDETEDGKPCIGGNAKFRIMVAADLQDVEADIASFTNTLFWSIVILGAGLIGATIFQVQWGLAPLDQVSKSLANIRAGRADKLEGPFPAEIEPLAEELNALVAHNAEVVSRARTHVGNLAHFLKTPLSVLANEVQGATGPLAETVARQVQTMRRQVDHYLARARTVASAQVIGARTEVAPVISDLARALNKIYSSRGIHVEKHCPEGMYFRGDRSDFEEMVGNLLDNACKWADGEVTVTVATSKPGRLSVLVVDDGPGLTDEQKKRVIERGERLDESKPGSGLGLGIVKEIAELYGGQLTLGRAQAGGLSAELDLPSVERVV